VKTSVVRLMSVYVPLTLLGATLLTGGYGWYVGREALAWQRDSDQIRAERVARVVVNAQLTAVEHVVGALSGSRALTVAVERGEERRAAQEVEAGFMHVDHGLDLVVVTRAGALWRSHSLGQDGPTQAVGEALASRADPAGTWHVVAAGGRRALLFVEPLVTDRGRVVAQIWGGIFIDNASASLRSKLRAAIGATSLDIGHSGAGHAFAVPLPARDETLALSVTLDDRPVLTMWRGHLTSVALWLLAGLVVVLWIGRTLRRAVAPSMDALMRYAAQVRAGRS
jgi:hypothetical protein